MNDNELITAWEKVLATGDAPIGEHWGCSITTKLAKETFDMLSRQKAEIEKINVYCENLEISQNHLLNECATARKTAKSEAYREFAERFRQCVTTAQRTPSTILNYSAFGIVNMIDHVHKELTEKNDLEGREYDIASQNLQFMRWRC